MTQKPITSPEAYFGHQMGADRKIARWDRIVMYFERLAAESDRIVVEELGKSTEGHPFLLAIISSPANLANLPRLREISARLADPAGLSEAEVQDLAAEGKAVICQTMSLHATEIGGTQMAPELAYDLLSRDDPEARSILDNVVFLMVPCFNPDGQIMVTDWYNKWLDTEYEGCTLPWLYQKYSGHDNNRDAFALNLAESGYLAKLMFREWYPPAYQDHHHMGSYGARLYVAPYCDPLHPHGDPLIWREHGWYGAHMAYRLEEEGVTGVLNAAQYAGWAHMGFHWLTIYHNIAGMLTESASARLASPLYIHPGQLTGAHGRTMPKYEAQTNFPNPWPGGWWRLRDIVAQQKTAAWALLDLAARFKDTVLHNAYRKASRQTARGESGTPRAYLIPAGQHDPLTVNKLVEILLDQGIEVRASEEAATIAGAVYPAGTFAVDCAQPKMGVVKTLLGRTRFPDNYWTRRPDGSPMIYDTTTDTVSEYMGVNVVPLETAPGDAFRAITAPPRTGGLVETGPVAGWYLDARLNDSYLVVNRLLADGTAVWRVAADQGPGEFPAGAFFVPAADQVEGRLRELIAATGVAPRGATTAPGAGRDPVKRLRIGMYQRYWGGNMDEGWTRLVLERFGFPYETIRDEDLVAGELHQRFDVIILPSDPKEAMLGPHEHQEDPRIKRMMSWIGSMPPDYRSGFGETGLAALRGFVAEGGRLVALDLAADLAIQACDLKVRNVTTGLDPKKYSTHGATLRVDLDLAHPLAQGMPARAWVLSWDSPAFEIQETRHAERYRPVARFPTADVLQSGWLIGEDQVAGKVAMLSVASGQGEVVLTGFRPQFRAQTHGTFKLLFNCLI